MCKSSLSPFQELVFRGSHNITTIKSFLNWKVYELWYRNEGTRDKG